MFQSYVTFTSRTPLLVCAVSPTKGALDGFSQTLVPLPKMRLGDERPAFMKDRRSEPAEKVHGNRTQLAQNEGIIMLLSKRRRRIQLPA